MRKIPICTCGDPRADHRGIMNTGSCTGSHCGCVYFLFSHFMPGPEPEPEDERIPGFAFTVLNDDPNHEPDPD